MKKLVYDAVIVGGGHHGTIIAPYLAKAGLSVGVFEKNERLGGGCVTDEGPAKGYKMAFCAQYTRFYAHPAYKHFKLYEEGLSYALPETGAGVVFDDGSSFITYPAMVLRDLKEVKYEYSEVNVQKTYEQIKQFSKDDADTYRYLTEKFIEKWGKVFSEDRYSLPTKDGRTPLETLLRDPHSGLDPDLQYMTSRQMAYYWFESAELRMFFLRGMLTSIGAAPDDAPGLDGMMGALSVIFSWSPPSVTIGGSGAVTEALVSAGKKLGVEYFVNTAVKEIIVKEGRAVGVKLWDGTEVEVKKLVVCDIGLPQLIRELLPKDIISKPIDRRLKSLVFNRNNILTGAVAVNELPRYTAEQANPDISKVFRLYLMPRDAFYIENRYWHELQLMGLPSRVCPLLTADSIWDPSRAPEGKHVIWFEEFTVPVSHLSRKEWSQLKERFVEERLLPEWQIYAPNMTKDNIIASRVNTPVEVLETHPDMIDGCFAAGAMIFSQMGWLRGIPGWRIRTPISNLYLCSQSMPGGQGIARGSSYRCWLAIKEDLGL